MIILGLNAFHADSSAALVRDGRLIAAAEEERFRRVKHWAGFPSQAIAYCLSEAGVNLSDVDHIGFNQDSHAHFLRKVLYFLTERPNINLVLRRLRNRRERVGFPALLEQAFPSQILRATIHPVEHHLAHLSSAFHVCPFDQAAVVSVDGFGDFSSAAWGTGTGSEIAPYGRVYFPHSLGIFYQAITQYLGFPQYGDEYKVMGLAAYGRPSYLDAMRKIVRLLPDGGFELDLKYFRHHREDVPYQWLACSGRAAELPIRSKSATTTSPIRPKRCTRRHSFTCSERCKGAAD
jgi:carbamoyltransferase